MSEALTMTDAMLGRLARHDLLHMHDMLIEAVDDEGPYRESWQRLLVRVQAELKRRDTQTD